MARTKATTVPVNGGLPYEGDISFEGKTWSCFGMPPASPSEDPCSFYLARMDASGMLIPDSRCSELFSRLGDCYSATDAQRAADRALAVFWTHEVAHA
jgi:hypothetical protein